MVKLGTEHTTQFCKNGDTEFTTTLILWSLCPNVNYETQVTYNTSMREFTIDPYPFNPKIYIFDVIQTRKDFFVYTKIEKLRIKKK